MKVLLRKDVDNLGYAGEVFDVADGYGRNYLIPRGMAVKATPKVLKSATKLRERAVTRRAEIEAEYQALSERIKGLELEFTARAGESGKLYGSVTTAEITDRLNETLGTEIDRRKLLGDSLRQLGTHRLTVRLSADVRAELTVVVKNEDEAVAAQVEGSADEDTLSEADSAAPTEVDALADAPDDSELEAV